jgi:hypothetical protein
MARRVHIFSYIFCLEWHPQDHVDVRHGMRRPLHKNPLAQGPYLDHHSRLRPCGHRALIRCELIRTTLLQRLQHCGDVNVKPMIDFNSNKTHCLILRPRVDIFHPSLNFRRHALSARPTRGSKNLHWVEHHEIGRGWIWTPGEPRRGRLLEDCGDLSNDI